MVRTSRVRLDALVEQAVVDCYDEDEQAHGLFAAIEENLRLPFRTTVLGLDVTVEKVDIRGGGQIVAVCSRGDRRQVLDLLDLPLPDPPPGGAEWIEAYRHWAGG